MTQHIKVLYEDNHLLVVEKPINLPVQADSSGDDDLLSILKNYIKEKYNKPGEVYLGLVHRLDRPVGGVMVFARTSKAAARLTQQFGGHGAKKLYCAIVQGVGIREGKLSDYIVRDESVGNSHIANADERGAKSAVLYITPVCEYNGNTLIDIELNTGRHHQIRVQLASRGTPIYGDARYNKSSKAGQQIALWAYSLTIEHPTKHERMTFTSIPQNGAWKDFSPQLIALEHGVRLVYCDENIFAVNKPRGVAVAQADGGSDTIEARLKTAFNEVYAVHRLDVATCGLVLFARNEIARDELEDAIRDRSVRKLYRCIAKGNFKENESLQTAYLLKDANAALVRVVSMPQDGAKEIKTAYTVIKRMKRADEACALVEIDLITGRTHQIRAHMAYLAHPLLGDDKYGDREWNLAEGDGKLCLCAVSVKTMLDKNKKLNYLNAKSITLLEPF